jgi:hypothetical protein
MRWIGWTAALAAGAVSLAHAQDESFPREPGQEKMTAAPSAKDDAEYFPKGAPVSGDVFIRCTLTAAGKVSDCALVRETPPGGGLAEAALQEVNLFRFKPMDSGGKPVAGRKVVLGQHYLAAGDANPDWVRKPTGTISPPSFPFGR